MSLEEATAKLHLEKGGELMKSLMAQNQLFRSALRTLYAETADYIRINNLGDVHHNQSMKDARNALEQTQ